LESVYFRTFGFPEFLNHLFMRILLNHCMACVGLILVSTGASAQMKGQARLDSLNGALAAAGKDTVKVNTLNLLSVDYKNTGDYEKAASLATRALSLCEKTPFKRGEGAAFHNLGAAFWMQGEYTKALKNFNAALDIRNEIADKPGIATTLNSIGALYYSQGNYTEAMKNYFASLKIKEEIGDKKGIAYTCNNLGTTYYEQANYPDALKNYGKALGILTDLGEKRGIATVYNNIGTVYTAQKNYPEALKNYNQALEIHDRIGNKVGIAFSYTSIGNIHNDQKRWDEALKNYEAALKILEELGDKNGIATVFAYIGEMNMRLGKYDVARKYLNDGLSLAKDLNIKPQIREAYLKLSRLDSATGNFSQALANYKKFMIYKDSLVNEENTRKITQQQMQFEFDSKEEAVRAEQEKKDVRQGIVGLSLAAILVIAVVFLLIVYRQRNRVAKEKLKSDELLVKSDNLLLNILPAEVADEIKRNGHSTAKTFSQVTVMFTDFKGFTAVSEKVSAELLVAEIDYCFSVFDDIVAKHGVEKIKTVGDAYMCVGGMPALNYTHAFDVVEAAIEMRNFMLERKKEKEAKGEIPFEMRLGIHTGPVVAGIVGKRKYAYDIWGDTVNIAARMESNSEAGKINISGSTYELIRSRIPCTYRGKIEAKNKGMIDMYFVEG